MHDPGCDFTNFSKQISANLHTFPFPEDEVYTQNLSNCCKHYCGPSLLQFFLNRILVGFLTFGPTHSRSRREGGRWAQLLLCAAFSSEAELAGLGW